MQCRKGLSPQGFPKQKTRIANHHNCERPTAHADAPRAALWRSIILPDFSTLGESHIAASGAQGLAPADAPDELVHEKRRRSALKGADERSQRWRWTVGAHNDQDTALVAGAQARLGGGVALAKSSRTDGTQERARSSQGPSVRARRVCVR